MYVCICIYICIKWKNKLIYIYICICVCTYTYTIWNGVLDKHCGVHTQAIKYYGYYSKYLVFFLNYL